MNPPTFKDLLDFVLENKKDKTFLGMTTMHIINLLQVGIQAGTLLYMQNSTGKICGMILAEKREDKKILFVTENLAMNIGNLKQFAAIAKQRWPKHKLEWLKHNIPKKHPTELIYSKLGIL